MVSDVRAPLGGITKKPLGMGVPGGLTAEEQAVLRAEFTPNLAAAQFLPLRTQRRLDRLISRATRRNRALWQALQAGRKAALADQAAYDDWLCQQSPPQFDDDVPF